MAQYYYFVSSLPSLVFSAPPPVTLDWFITEAERNLSPRDFSELRALLDGDRDSVSTSFSREWLSGEVQLRNAVARTRALSRGVDEKPFVKDHDYYRVDVENAVSDAYSRTHPGDRERVLDRHRWNLAFRLSLNNAFGLEAILTYAIKLRILERWKPLTPEAGREKLDEWVGRIETVPVESEIRTA